MWVAHRTWDSVGRVIVQDRLSVSHQGKKLRSQPTAQIVLTLRKSKIKLRQALDSTFTAKREPLRSLKRCQNVRQNRRMCIKEITSHHLIIKVSIRCCRLVSLAAKKQPSPPSLQWSNRAISIAALQSPITLNTPNTVRHLPKIETATSALMDPLHTLQECSTARTRPWIRKPSKISVQVSLMSRTFQPSKYSRNIYNLKNQKTRML